MTIPLYRDMLPTVLRALQELGGQAKTQDVERAVADILGLTQEERTAIHQGKKTTLSYRVAWARFALKKQGLLDSSIKRGTSALSDKGKEQLGMISKDEDVVEVR
jgi:restriction endonuclease Mrr